MNYEENIEQILGKINKSHKLDEDSYLAFRQEISNEILGLVLKAYRLGNKSAKPNNELFEDLMKEWK